jgi:hypothetical protein
MDIVERLRQIDISWSEHGEWCAEAADEIERLRASMADLKYRETYFERAYMAARKTLDSKGIHMDYFLSRADYEAELKGGK